VLVTTVPVAEPPGIVGRVKYLVKHAIGRPTRIDTLIEFNDWLKDYARREQVPFFDLEAVVRRSAGERWLRPDFDSGDQLHVNAEAYRAIDGAFAAFLTSQTWGAAR
jgi:hypothetical protein